ncbi:ribose-5-phosphate isomerase [Nonomuraea aridisoli]|uniref:Ribose-5-phosphate isomerase n=2 Tax=Nonomuraea aridisoli TaxID=2070368 RepID=A0A2W2E0K3_9ACTN|nr:ribose-5-phosphate isomerase [Nonomuraea aridisoli]
MRIAIAADHHGLALKARLIARLTAQGHELDDRGAHAGGVTVDYPPLCADVCGRVADGRADRAIVVGGSGMGELIACNKIRGIRAGLCHDVFTTEISRAHNDANVIVIGAKVIGPETAEELVDLWLSTPFKGGRHQERLDQIAMLERGDPPA